MFYFLDIDKEFQGLPSDVDVSTGAKVVIPCKAPKGFPPPSITWLKDGKMLSLIEGKRYEEVVQREKVYPS